MKAKQHSFLFLSLLFFLFLSWGCKKKSDENTSPTQNSTPNYTVPAYYTTFTNVDHVESTTVIGMLSELSTEIAKGTGTSTSTTPSPITVQHLLDLFHNQNSPFSSNASYNTSGYQIANNCLPSSVSELESFLDTLATVSASGTAASNGVPGLGLSKDAPPKRFLLTGNGVNYSQLLFKNLMCDLIYYQISTRVADNSLDNTTTLAGKNYTAMEHNWDIAFGYWSVPDSFPIVKTPVKYWGSYSNQIDKGLSCNKTVMDAFLKGRAAISNNDMTTKQEQANIIIAQFDVMTAGAVVQELNETTAPIAAADQVKIISVLSELRGFVMSMKNNKNPKRIITDSQIETLLGYIPTNHWDVTNDDLNNIKTYIASVYGFTPDQLINL